MASVSTRKSASTRASNGWVRIGVRSDLIMVIVALLLSLAFSYVLFAAPVTKIAEITTGESQNFTHIALWTAGAIFVIIAPLFLFMTGRPLELDLDRRVMRVGWRTVPFDRVRHAYRRPGGGLYGDGLQWILQLEIRRGLDARLPMWTTAQADLNAVELETLLAMLEYAPIEPKQGETVRAPLDDELGKRSAAERVADRVSLAIMPHTRVAFTKPTLLLEVRKRLEEVRKQEELDGTDIDRPGAVSRVLHGLVNGAGQGPAGVGTKGMILPPESLPERAKGRSGSGHDPHAPLRRGMFGTCTFAFRRERLEVEKWLREQGAAAVPRYAPSRVLGWLVVLAAAPLPWIYPSVLTVITWPFILWAGVLVTYRARVKRYIAVRSAAMGVLQSGATIPPFVAEFFEPRFPERNYGKHVYAFGVGVAVLLILPGLLSVLTGMFSAMAGWAAGPNEGDKPYFGVVLALIVACITLMVRWNYSTIRTLARASAEWRSLSGFTEI